MWGDSPEVRPAEIPTDEVVPGIPTTVFSAVFVLGKSACKDY